MSLNNPLLPIYYEVHTASPAVKSEGKGKQSRVTSEPLPKPIICKMFIDFSNQERAGFSNSCIISPLQISLQPAAWILCMDWSPLAWKAMWWVGADTLSPWLFHWGHGPSATQSAGTECQPNYCFYPLLFKAETFILNSKPHNSLHFVAGLLRQGMPVRLASHVFIKAWLFHTISFTTFGSDSYNLDHLKQHCQFCQTQEEALHCK